MSSPTTSRFAIPFLAIASAIRTGYDHIISAYNSLVSEPEKPPSTEEREPRAPVYPRRPLEPIQPRHPSDVGTPEWEVRPGASEGIELRNRAQEAYKLMRSEREKAREARQSGRRADVQRHSKLADAQKAQAEKLNRDAAEALFNGNNEGKGRSTSEVDLHDLYVEEALDYAKRALDKARDEGLLFMTFIVGKGSHSKNGEAKIKPKVQELLYGLNIPCKVSPRNEGLLMVTLGENRSSSDYSE